MIEVDKAIKNNEIEAKMVMQIHDELVFYVKEEDADKIAQKIKSKMENAFTQELNLKAEIGMGNNWLEAK
jgi:DNA polymerase-1